MEGLHKLYRIIKNKLREYIILRKRNTINNTDFTIISSDCTGGVVYYELHQKFLSPTINMFMMADDFVRFAKILNFGLISL